MRPEQGTAKGRRANTEWAGYYDRPMGQEQLFAILFPENYFATSADFIVACATISDNQRVQALSPDIRYAAHMAAAQFLANNVFSE